MFAMHVYIYRITQRALSLNTQPNVDHTPPTPMCKHALLQTWVVTKCFTLGAMAHTIRCFNCCSRSVAWGYWFLFLVALGRWFLVSGLRRMRQRKRSRAALRSFMISYSASMAHDTASISAPTSSLASAPTGSGASPTVTVTANDCAFCPAATNGAAVGGGAAAMVARRWALAQPVVARPPRDHKWGVVAAALPSRGRPMRRPRRLCRHHAARARGARVLRAASPIAVGGAERLVGRESVSLGMAP